MFKSFIFLAVWGVCVSLPVFDDASSATILRDDRVGPLSDGSYSFAYETSDGIKRQEEGTPTGPGGAIVMRGSWSFTFPDGSVAEFSYIADENGYRVESPLLPAIPPHSIVQIAEFQRGSVPGLGDKTRVFDPDFDQVFQEGFEDPGRRPRPTRFK